MSFGLKQNKIKNLINQKKELLKNIKELMAEFNKKILPEEEIKELIIAIEDLKSEINMIELEIGEI